MFLIVMNWCCIEMLLEIEEHHIMYILLYFYV